MHDWTSSFETEYFDVWRNTEYSFSMTWRFQTEDSSGLYAPPRQPMLLAGRGAYGFFLPYIKAWSKHHNLESYNANETWKKVNERLAAWNNYQWSQLNRSLSDTHSWIYCYVCWNKRKGIPGDWASRKAVTLSLFAVYPPSTFSFLLSHSPLFTPVLPHSSSGLFTLSRLLCLYS